MAETISKDYCNQLSGSINWFKKEYDNNFTAIPIIIHKAIILDAVATPPENMRIINEEKLIKLKDNISNFVNAYVLENQKDEAHVYLLLKAYKLRREDFVAEYTMPPRR